MSATGLIYDIQGFSIQDGPGIRTTVFMKGCPLHCPWCHSPESQSFEKQVCFKKNDCLGIDECGSCIGVCPNHAIKADENLEHIGNGPRQPKIDHAVCTDCGVCSQACCSKALYICGDEYTVDSAKERVMKDRRFYETSGGGVTLSGGEPMSQFDFALEFLASCKDSGLNTALDTTGFAAWEHYKEILPYVDLFLYDLKCMDSAAHRTATGVPNEIILENARQIARAGGKLQIRIPVIPLFNNNADNMKSAAEFCAELGEAVTFVQLLPYHTMGLSKYEKLGTSAPVFEANPLQDEQVSHLIDYFSELNVRARLH